MEIWLDSTNTSLIKKARKLGILHGITTNPLLLSKEGKHQEAVFQDILSAQSGPVTAEITAVDSEGMILQADHYHQISKRMIIKVPVTVEGLNAIHQLSRQNVVTMATGLLHPNQALLAALAGANYVTPSLSGNSMEMIQSMAKIFANYKLETKILVASINHVEEIRQCAELGVDAITLNDEVFTDLVESNGMKMQASGQLTPDPSYVLAFS